jgi:hypothetical protein
MTGTTTVWHLGQSGGRAAHCLVSRRRATWQIVVWTSRGIVAWEHHGTPDGAMARARDLRAQLETSSWRGDGRAAVPVPAADSDPPAPPAKWMRLPDWWAPPAMLTAGMAALWLWRGHRRSRMRMPRTGGAVSLDRAGLHVSSGLRFAHACATTFHW